MIQRPLAALRGTAGRIIAQRAKYDTDAISKSSLSRPFRTRVLAATSPLRNARASRRQGCFASKIVPSIGSKAGPQ